MAGRSQNLLTPPQREASPFTEHKDSEKDLQEGDCSPEKGTFQALEGTQNFRKL